MAADCLKIKKRFKCRKKFMEQSFKCSSGLAEATPKFLCQQIESPPPKPPRRRYSDQISTSSLGKLSTDKKYDENTVKYCLKAKINDISAKPTYLSLPANLTSTPLTEHNNPSKLLPYSNFSDKLKCFKENGSLTSFKVCPEKFQYSESNIKQAYTSINMFQNREDTRSMSHETFMDDTFSKFQIRNLTSYSNDDIIQDMLCNNLFSVKNSDNLCFNSSKKMNRRRHHSDPIMSYFKISNKGDSHKCSDNFSFSSKVFKKCDTLSTCSCCKKNYFILQEIQILKEINEKLWQNLCTAQSCLENTKKKTSEECIDLSISGLLSSMYYAQKAKDNAMEERLKIALEERDTAVLELENFISIFIKNFDAINALKCEEKELNEVLKEFLYEVGCSPTPSTILKCQMKLLTNIFSIKNSKQDSNSLELSCAMTERDNALEKVAKLEEEIKALKLCFDLWNLDNKHWELTLFDVVHQLIHQRDSILSKVDNIGVDNILCSTQATKLDSIKQYSMLQFDYLPKSTESHSSHQMVFNDCKDPKSFEKSEDINKLQEEILLLNSKLEEEKSKREQAEGKCLRLEKLINTLRKKINGQNIGILV